MSRIRLSATFRAAWARILAFGEQDEKDRAKLDATGAEAMAVNRTRVLAIVASRICARWEAAGYTSARLVDGLPQPERPHPAIWQGEGRFSHCGVCGRPDWRRLRPVDCPGPSGLELVIQALSQGVPFGLRDGLPTAGAPVEGDTRAKLARATCQPVRVSEAA